MSGNLLVALELTAVAVVALLALLLQRLRVQAAIHSVPIRIHVGGTRGKTATCRRIAAALRTRGIRTLAKTTGTEPRLILPDGTQQRWSRTGPPNISEQRRFMLLARRMNARAIVVECMAVRPDLVWASERYFIRSTVSVITNIRPDHLEETPSVEAIETSFLGLVPQHGVLVAGRDALFPALRDRAAAYRSRIVPVDTAGLSPEEANAAIALAACEAAGLAVASLPRERPGAPGDSGAFEIVTVALAGQQFRFANAFACNDVESLRLLWDAHARPSDRPVVLLNHRNDRPLRSIAFLEHFASLSEPPPLLLLASTPWLRRAARRRNLRWKALAIGSRSAPRECLERVAAAVPSGAFVWGVANYHGAGALITAGVKETQACLP